MKRTIIIIVIGTLVLVAALWGASRHFGWFPEEIAEPVDTFVYDDTQPIDLKDKTKVYDLIVLDMSRSMDTIRNSVVDGFNTLLDGLKMANAKYSGTQEHSVVMFLYRPEYYGIEEDECGNTEGKVQIFIAKNDFGETGFVRLNFVGRSRIEDIECCIPEMPSIMNETDNESLF